MSERGTGNPGSLDVPSAYPGPPMPDKREADAALELLFTRAQEEGLRTAPSSAPLLPPPPPRFIRIPVGDRPHSVAGNPAGTRLYVTNFGDGTVSVIELSVSDGKVVAVQAVGEGPYGVAVSRDGRKLYVVCPGQGTVTMYSIQADELVQDGPILHLSDHESRPYGVAVSPDGDRVYVTQALSDRVLVTDRFLKKMDVIEGVGFPVSASVGLDGTRLYVANYFADTVSIIDVPSKTVVARRKTLAGPYGVAVSPDGRRLVVSHFDSPAPLVGLSMIDPNGQSPDKVVRLGTFLRGVAIVGGFTCATDFFSDSVVLY